MGCTREHQLRWLMEAWDGACEARNAECDVRAVTAWALFGSFGWDSLVTREPFTYECGAFDVRSPEPRETALAGLIRDLTAHSTCSHPAMDSRGWWRAADRLTVKPFTVSTRNHGRREIEKACLEGRRIRPILVTGARGTLGSAFVRICRQRRLAVRATTREEMNVTDPASVRAVLDTVRPWAIINAAGYVRVDDAERERTACYEANTTAVGILAAESSRLGIPFATFSSDLVFNGLKSTPYVESDRVSPLGAYGASKAAAELRAMTLHKDSLVIRASAFFGPWDQWNFAVIALRSLTNGIPFPAALDSIVSPTYVPDLVNASLDLLIDGESGIWHLANSGETSWSQIAMEIASRAGVSPSLVRPVPSSELGLQARRPAYSALGTERGQLLSSLDDALDRWCDAVNVRDLNTSPAMQP
jgi:dTDP-4-dehydrorhamnose reductase